MLTKKIDVIKREKITIVSGYFGGSIGVYIMCIYCYSDVKGVTGCIPFLCLSVGYFVIVIVL